MRLEIRRHSKGTIISLQCKDVVISRIIDIILLVLRICLAIYLV